jgi:hypothetical protein
MAKRKERKYSDGQASRRTQSSAGEPAQDRTALRTRPLASFEQDKKYNTPTRDVQRALASPPIRRRQLLIGCTGLIASAMAMGEWLWVTRPRRRTVVPSNGMGGQLVRRWNEATLSALRILQPPMPVAARALAIVHTCMFDAWAAYHPTALGTQLGGLLRRPADERTVANRCQAISFAAYRALLDLFPGAQAHFSQVMESLGYMPSGQVHDSVPAAIGEQAARVVLAARHRDGANQLGDLSPGAYADYTSYQPANTADTAKNVQLWQPLRMADGQKILKVQSFDCPQWGNVTPFALTSAVQFVPEPGPVRPVDPAYSEQAHQILHYSAELTAEQKIMAEYWSNGPAAEKPAGHWCLFAQTIAQRDNYTLDQSIVLFFILANALLDTSIVCWATKRAYNTAYPLTVIHTLFKDKQVRAWAGPGKEVQWIDGQYWLPYQPLSSIAPAFPEYCSEQSAFSAAAAEVLRRFTGSDRLQLSYTFPAYASHIDPGTPITDITLSWQTFSQAADQAGLAGRYSGTHFTRSDLDGRVLGRQVGEQVWQKAQKYIHNSA